MKIVLKIMLILILVFTLLGLTLTAVFTIYKDVIFKKAQNYLERELSLRSGLNIHFDSMKYVPLYSISISRLTVGKPDDPAISIANINEITISLDLLSLLKNKQLKTTITIDGLYSGELLCNAVIRTVSKKAAGYKKAFDALNLESVSIIEATIAAKDITLKNVFGIITIDNRVISKGKLHFAYNDATYAVNLSRLNQEKPSYEVFITTNNFKSNGIFTKDSSRIIIDNLSGSFYALNFNFAGALENYLTPERTLSLEGLVKTDLGELSFLRKYLLSGTVVADVNLKTTGLNLTDYVLTSTIFSDEIFIDKIPLKGLTAELSMENGKLTISSLSARAYGGELTSSLKTALTEKDLPYLFSLSISNMNFGFLMRDITAGNINVYGTLDGELSLKGYLAIAETTEGKGKIAIKNADLGPMPIFTPLLGNIFSYIQNLMPGAQKVTVTEASADFVVENKKIKTKNILLSGSDIYSTAEGYVAFDGELDFMVENHFKEPEGEETAWQTNLRNAIVRFGKFIGKARLKGTIKDPKWEFEQRDFLGDLIGGKVKGLLNTF